MSIAAYAIIFFLALAGYSTTIIGSNCPESGCGAGLSCVDANNELCNSAKTLKCHCKPENDTGLIVTFHKTLNQNDQVFSLPIAHNGTPSLDPIWSHSFPTTERYFRVDVDNMLQQAYIYHNGEKTIYKNPNYNFGNTTENVWTDLHKGISNAILKIAVDWVGHNIYWTDPTFRWIMVQSLLGHDTSMYRVLIHENLENPHALAMDPKEALLFWSDVGTFTKIEVSSLSGRNRKTLLYSNLLHTYSMAADYEGRRLYFVDTLRHTLESVTYDGKDRKLLLDTIHGGFTDIAIYKDYLYVTGSLHITFINKTNGNVLGKTREQQEGTFYAGVAVLQHDIQPSPVTKHCVNYNCEHICLTEKNGATCICKDGYILNQDMKTCSLNSKYFHRALVFSNESSICIVDIRVLADFVFDPVCVLETTGTKYMIMDTDGRHIIIANDTAIYWTSVDKPELQILTEPSGAISGMAWDGFGRDLYWTELDTGKIWRMPIESKQVEPFKEGLTNPRDILILPHDRLVYWISDRNGSTIESSNIDGSNLHVVLNSDDSLKSLSYDQHKKRIYFLKISNEKKTEVIYCNLDCSKRASFFDASTILERLEIFKGYLLVTGQEPEETLITILSLYDRRHNTSGVFNGMGIISDIKIFDENNRQNETGPCYNMNGECEQICIANGMSRICKCVFGFKLARDGKTCISDPIKDNFMLVSDLTHDQIYQISLNDQSVQAIKAKEVNPVYDPLHDLLLWRTRYGDTLFSMHLDGTMKKHFRLEKSRSASLFNVDYSTGNLYYASHDRQTELHFISVRSPDEKHIDLWKGLGDITGLVLFPSEGYMFYLHQESLERALMDGTGSESLLDDLDEPTGLTIDYKNEYLYWIGFNYNEQSYQIEYCKLDGTNRNTLVQFKETILNRHGPKELAVYEDYMFINAKFVSRLIKLKISTPNEMTEFTVQGSLGRIGDVNIYSSAAQKKNALCSIRNGGCSTFCLPVPGGVKCACEDGVGLKEGSTSVCSNIPSMMAGL